MALTDTTIRQAKPSIKAYKMADGHGLYLLVSQTGGKLWRFKYRFGGKEKLLTLGSYPETGLALARRRHQEARELLAQGVDPGQAKKEAKTGKKLAASNSFEAIACAWMDERGQGVSDSTREHTAAWMKNDVFPWLGNRPITEIDAPEILSLLKRIDGRGARNTAHKVRSYIGQVFRYGIQQGVCKANPASDLVGAIPTPKTKHFAAFTDPAKVGELMRAMDGFSGTYPVQCALRLAPLLFARPGELRTMEWAHVDLDRAEWRYTVSKTNTPHLVPLARQAVAILRDLHALTGHGRYVFPGMRSREQPMSETALNAALRRMGYDTRSEITAHGFRAVARTILHERLGTRWEAIEHQLSHVVPDNLGGAYNRTKFIDERVAMMQTWADYLDMLKAGASIISLHTAA